MLHKDKKKRTSEFRSKRLPKGGIPSKRVKFKPPSGDPSSAGPMSEWLTLTPSSDPVSPDRYEGALDQINAWRECAKLPPLTGEDRKKCERVVVAAVGVVEYLRKWAPVITPPKKARTVYEAAAKKERKAAERREGGHRRLLEEDAAVMDMRAAMERPHISPRKQAVYLADLLLTHFGDGKVPGLTLDRHWQKLSKILFGGFDEPADMYQTMRWFRAISRPYSDYFYPHLSYPRRVALLKFAIEEDILAL